MARWGISRRNSLFNPSKLVSQRHPESTGSIETETHQDPLSPTYSHRFMVVKAEQRRYIRDPKYYSAWNQKRENVVLGFG